jgi:hypothetical protein
MPALPRDLRALAGTCRSAIGRMVVGRGAAGPALSLADQALVSACNFATTIVLAHALGLEAFGLFSTAWIVVLLTVSLQLGLVVCPMISIGPGLPGEAGHSYYAIVLVHEAAFLALAGSAVAVAGSPWPSATGRSRSRRVRPAPPISPRTFRAATCSPAAGRRWCSASTRSTRGSSWRCWCCSRAATCSRRPAPWRSSPPRPSCPVSARSRSAGGWHGGPANSARRAGGNGSPAAGWF